ncbi:MAG: tRNA (guanosine(37)-N1)-methyltransferase TrmD [Candidatus Dormibacteraceae bacterium]
MRFDVISIFPDLFPPLFQTGVVGRAWQQNRLQLAAHDLRDYALDRSRHIDDAPFGGGAGMVLQAEPVSRAVEAVRSSNSGPLFFTEPWGQPLTQELARELALEPGLILVCGRYEGIDERARQELGAREISIGPYILSGGELATMVVIDAVARLLPGVVGDQQSLEQDAFGAVPGGYPQFTRPGEWRGRRVPEVLLSGDHAAIARWRAANSR